MAREILPHESAPIGQPVREARAARQQQQMRLQTNPPATTNVFARETRPRRRRVGRGSRSLGRCARSPPVASTSRLTSVAGHSVTCFDARSAFQVESGEYFAPIGQIGVQVSLRRHALRPSHATEFLADGWLHVGMPADVAHAFSFSRL